MSSKQNSNFDADRIIKIFDSLFIKPITEIGYGIQSNSINYLFCLTPGCIFNLIILFSIDSKVFNFLGFGWLLPPSSAFGHLLYSFVFSFSGFLVWGIWQTVIRNQISVRLTEVFLTSGLKNSIGKLPGFVFDRPIDEFNRKIRLTRANLPVSQFISAKDHLESALQVYIDEFKENRESGTIDITYANLSMPSEVSIGNISKYGKCQFFVGETRAKKVSANLDETPHILVGGQSGGGKSTFLRQAITTLYLNNKDFSFYLIDLKGGLEFQLFENLDRIKVIPSTQSAIDYLKRLEEQLKKRMEFLKKAECKDITSFKTKSFEEQKALESKFNDGIKFSRTIIVIDEAAELFLAGDKTQAQKAQQAKTAAIKIAAQGRAVGIHLIVATQRPDVKAIDGQIKTNLSGMIAFQMPNHASSMTILDNTRAAHLPKVPGRAIWKSGLEMVEVQTPFLSVDEVHNLLKPLKVQKEEVNENI